MYYPSINYKEFIRYNKRFHKKYNIYPNEITILAYDALGFIYYGESAEINQEAHDAYQEKLKKEMKEKNLI